MKKKLREGKERKLVREKRNKKRKSTFQYRKMLNNVN